MMGGLCFNDWLMQEGYLAMSEPLSEPTPIAKAPIDWARTVAWGDGGYYGRCFLNVKGREPQGIVEPVAVRGGPRRADREAGGGARPGRRAARDEGAEAAGRLPGGARRRARTSSCTSATWPGARSGSVGNPSLYTYENDTGPDGANHDRTAVFAMKGLPGQPTGQVDGMNLVDVGPSILKLYDIEAPEGVVGRSFL